VKRSSVLEKLWQYPESRGTRFAGAGIANSKDQAAFQVAPNRISLVIVRPFAHQTRLISTLVRELLGQLSQKTTPFNA